MSWVMWETGLMSGTVPEREEQDESGVGGGWCDGEYIVEFCHTVGRMPSDDSWENIAECRGAVFNHWWRVAGLGTSLERE